MPSHEHETFVDLLGDAPADLSEILRAAGVSELPAFTRMERVDTDLTQALPVEYAADGVFRLSGAGGDSSWVVILEVQRQPDADKEWTWPVYLTVVRARERSETTLAVLATNEATADWARRGIALDRSHVWRPLVIGPSTLPAVATIETAKARPVLAIVWALTHVQKESDVPAVKAILDGVSQSTLDQGLVQYYSDVILQAASDQVRRLLEVLMRVPEGYEIQNPVLKKLCHDSEEKGRREGADAVLEGMRSVLYARASLQGLVLTDRQRALVSDCRDPVTLGDWSARSLSAKTPAEIFASMAEPTQH